MNCEQCLAYLETGSLWQRFRARQHASKCPQCARAIEALAELKRDLATCEPLTPDQVRLWQRAAPQTVSQSTVQWPVWQLTFGRAAVVVASSLALSFFFFWNGWRPPPELAQKIDPVPELTQLHDKLDTLEAEIANLSTKAELSDVHQQVLAMIDTYKRW